MSPTLSLPQPGQSCLLGRSSLQGGGLPPAVGCIAPGESLAPLPRAPRAESPWGQGFWVPCAEQIMMAEQSPEVPWALLWARARSASHHSSYPLSGSRGQSIIITPELWVRCTARVSEQDEGDGAVRQVGAGPGSSGVHTGHPLYIPGSRPSAGLLHSFLVGGDFLAAKKMGRMSASLWCLAGD